MDKVSTAPGRLTHSSELLDVCPAGRLLQVNDALSSLTCNCVTLNTCVNL